jgi:uncharacterized protein YbjT (DUF2867 family)
MILITGASGNVGTELARLLTARQVPFRAMVRSPGVAQKPEALAGAEIVAGDFNDAASIAGALAGIDRGANPHRRRVDFFATRFFAAARRSAGFLPAACGLGSTNTSSRD